MWKTFYIKTSLYCNEPRIDEVVYDLLLAGYPTYFVGGPDTFLVVEAEACNPEFDVPTTLAVTAAMQASKSASQRLLQDPAADIPPRLRELNIENTVAKARHSALQLGESNTQLVPLSRDFYLRDGVWDPHASMLETHFVRQFGRTFRRESSTAWRIYRGTSGPDDHFSVLLYDIDLIGEAPIPANESASIKFRVTGGSDDFVGQIDLPARSAPSWYLTPDAQIDFGTYPNQATDASLEGCILVGESLIGTFRALVPPVQEPAGICEYFIFSTDSKVIGRIALEQRRLSQPALLEEKELAQLWDTSKKEALAISMGKQLGHQFVGLIDR